MPSIKRYVAYWRKAAAAAFERTPFWSTAKALLMALLTALISECYHLKPLRELADVLLIAVIVYLFFWVAELVWKMLVCSPVTLDETQSQALKESEEKLETFRSEAPERPSLTIELENETEGWATTQAKRCRVIVRNASGALATNVHLELTKIESGPSSDPPIFEKGVSIPYKLPVAGTEEKKADIHPGGREFFVLFEYAVEQSIKYNLYLFPHEAKATGGYRTSPADIMLKAASKQEWNLELQAFGGVKPVTRWFKLTSEPIPTPCTLKPK